jgi:hypothetical protein
MLEHPAEFDLIGKFAVAVPSTPITPPSLPIVGDHFGDHSERASYALAFNVFPQTNTQRS